MPLIITSQKVLRVLLVTFVLAAAPLWAPQPAGGTSEQSAVKTGECPFCRGATVDCFKNVDSECLKKVVSEVQKLFRDPASHRKDFSIAQDVAFSCLMQNILKALSQDVSAPEMFLYFGMLEYLCGESGLLSTSGWSKRRFSCTMTSGNISQNDGQFDALNGTIKIGNLVARQICILLGEILSRKEIYSQYAAMWSGEYDTEWKNFAVGTATKKSLSGAMYRLVTSFITALRNECATEPIDHCCAANFVGYMSNFIEKLGVLSVCVERGLVESVTQASSSSLVSGSSSSSFSSAYSAMAASASSPQRLSCAISVAAPSFSSSSATSTECGALPCCQKGTCRLNCSGECLKQNVAVLQMSLEFNKDLCPRWFTEWCISLCKLVQNSKILAELCFYLGMLEYLCGQNGILGQYGVCAGSLQCAAEGDAAACAKIGYLYAQRRSALFNISENTVSTLTTAGRPVWTWTEEDAQAWQQLSLPRGVAVRECVHSLLERENSTLGDTEHSAEMDAFIKCLGTSATGGI